MKRIFWSLTLVLSLFSLSACTKKNASDERLFVYVSMDEPLAQKLFAAYQTKTGNKVEFVRLSTGEATARLEAEKSNPQASLWIGGVGLGHGEAKFKQLTEAYKSPAAATMDPRFKDQDHFWTGIYLGVLAFASNTKELQKNNLTAPESWSDIVDPKWKGKVQIPNPGTSGTSYNLITTWISLWKETEAFSYMKKLHQNINQYTRSGAAPAKNVAIGESTMAIGYAHDIIRLTEETKAPLVVTLPKEGTGYEIAAMSLIKGAKNIEKAKLLYDWMLGQEAAQIMADYYIFPIVKEGITFKPNALDPSKVKLIDTDINWAGENKSRLIEMWNDKING